MKADRLENLVIMNVVEMTGHRVVVSLKYWAALVRI